MLKIIGYWSWAFRKRDNVWDFPGKEREGLKKNPSNKILKGQGETEEYHFMKENNGEFFIQTWTCWINQLFKSFSSRNRYTTSVLFVLNCPNI